MPQSYFRYNLTSEDVKNEARFGDSVGVFPEFIDGYNILILPTTGRYFQVCAISLQICAFICKFSHHSPCFRYLMDVCSLWGWRTCSWLGAASPEIW